MSICKKTCTIALIAGLIIAIGFAFCAPAAHAASKKSVYLIRITDTDDPISYYDNGLLKTYWHSYYKYDSKGRMTEMKMFNTENVKKMKKKNLLSRFKFSYSKKGKLKKVIKIDYKNGKAVSKRKFSLKVGKKNRILKAKFRYKNDDPMSATVLGWEYNSKGQIKKSITKFKFTDLENKIIHLCYIDSYRWDSKGYRKWTKSIEKKNGKKVSTTTYHYEYIIKSGEIKGIKAKDDGWASDYLSKKKKVPAKYVKVIREQQKALVNSASSSFEDMIIYISSNFTSLEDDSQEE